MKNKRLYIKTFFLSALSVFVLKGIAQDTIKHADAGDTSKKQLVTVDSRTFMKVEIESEYRGGAGAWARFLQANMHYPDKAVRRKIQGSVVVQFIIDQQGDVSDVGAISGPENGGLREEAVRVIKISGKWVPAVQGGKKVKSYKKQPIIFRLE